MTGEKNRGTSLEKLWNLDDKQLTTPKHDELVLGITQEFIFRCFPDLISDFLKRGDYWQWPGDREPASAYNRSVRAVESLSKNKYKESIFGRVTIDGNLQIRSYYGSVIENTEYINDYKNELKNQEIQSKWHIDLYSGFCSFLNALDFISLVGVLKIVHEVPIVQAYNKFIIGYWDCVVSFNPDYKINFELPDGKVISIKINAPPVIFYIEAKPYVDSYGAVIRQIKTYQNYMDTNPNNIVCLLTPDSTFNDAFESQGITVISPC